MKKINYKIIEIKPRILLISFTDSYDMAMTFLRYQEFYESPSPKFRGKPFVLLDFMEWYSKKYGNGCFTYARDWSGFNFPNTNYLEVQDAYFLNYYDYNKYDRVMMEIYDKCCLMVSEKYKDNNLSFYIIGAKAKQKSIIKHEIAHGFYFTNNSYKEEMNKLVKELNPKFRKAMYAYLKKIGYASKVCIDECQAYLSTGLPQGFEVETTVECKPFIKLYNKYYKETNVT